LSLRTFTCRPKDDDDDDDDFGDDDNFDDDDGTFGDGPSSMLTSSGFRFPSLVVGAEADGDMVLEWMDGWIDGWTERCNTGSLVVHLLSVYYS
jgi:hypothetical protein